MAEKTNKERLATIEQCIIHIDKNIDLQVKNNKEQWKQINKNAQSIAGIRGASGVIAGIVSIIMAGIMTYVFQSKMINEYFNRHTFFVRRIMTSVMFTLWCLVSIIAGYRLLINQVALPEGFRDFYYSFTGAVTIAIGFYYKGRNGGIKEKIESKGNE